MLVRMSECVQLRLDNELDSLNRALERRIRRLGKKVKSGGAASVELTQAYEYRNQVLRQVFNDRNCDSENTFVVSSVARGLREDV